MKAPSDQRVREPATHAKPEMEADAGVRAARRRMIAEIEEHSPEGRGVSPSLARLERRILIPLVIGSILGGLASMYLLAGWAGVVVGGVSLVVYYAIGWSAEIGAAVLRRGEREKVEREVTARLHANR